MERYTPYNLDILVSPNRLVRHRWTTTKIRVVYKLTPTKKKHIITSMAAKPCRDRRTR